MMRIYQHVCVLAVALMAGQAGAQGAPLVFAVN